VRSVALFLEAAQQRRSQFSYTKEFNKRDQKNFISFYIYVYNYNNAKTISFKKQAYMHGKERETTLQNSL